MDCNVNFSIPQKNSDKIVKNSFDLLLKQNTVPLCAKPNPTHILVFKSNAIICYVEKKSPQNWAEIEFYHHPILMYRKRRQHFWFFVHSIFIIILLLLIIYRCSRYAWIGLDWIENVRIITTSAKCLEVMKNVLRMSASVIFHSSRNHFSRTMIYYCFKN